MCIRDSLPINILEDFTKPLSLSFRLFGNILADELVVSGLFIVCHWINNYLNDGHIYVINKTSLYRHGYLSLERFNSYNRPHQN